MARLDLGFDRNESGWPATPGVDAAVKRMVDAEDAHGRASALRARRSEEDVAMAEIGRTLVKGIADGSIDASRLPSGLTYLVDAARIRQTED